MADDSPDWSELLAIIQHDAGGRGFARDPDENLLTATAGQFAAAARKLARADRPRVAIVTGFTIPSAEPPVGETDGPPGALFLARALVPLGIPVALASDGTTFPALWAGVVAAGLADRVPVVELPEASADIYAKNLSEVYHQDRGAYLSEFFARAGPADFLIAVERVGPSHTTESMLHAGFAPGFERFRREISPAQMGRCYSMRGRDLTDLTRPAHLLFETPRAVVTGGLTTIGIGDGGNEIGMGNIPWDTIRRNVSRGDLVACRVRCDELIVAGVSNWGAYGLATAVRRLRGAKADRRLYDADTERSLIRMMSRAGPLIDGVTGEPGDSVDGLPFERHAEVLERLAKF